MNTVSEKVSTLQSQMKDKVETTLVDTLLKTVNSNTAKINGKADKSDISAIKGQVSTLKVETDKIR